MRVLFCIDVTGQRVLSLNNHSAQKQEQQNRG